ncbi:hypothetical protein FS749_008641 [Ceratobasidium sp. UAMH 11750]|nr:hypothetical protein FS749_008641 [Ceratobasidium sp. UAMH 11750]
MALARYEEAIADLVRLKDIVSDEANVWLTLGRAYWATGRRTAATQHLTVAQELDPKLVGAVRELMERGEEGETGDSTMDESTSRRQPPLPHRPLSPPRQLIVTVAQPTATMSHTIHIHRSVISSPSRMSSTRPITNEWASLVSRRKLQLACAGGSRRDVGILHRLVLISNFAHAHDVDERQPAPVPATQPDAFVFPDISDQPPPPPAALDEAGWLDAILQELEEEAEVMVSCLPAEDPASTSGAPAEDDVIVCDSYFSICSCPQPQAPSPESSTDNLGDSLSDLPFYSTPSLTDSMDVDEDEDGPATPDTSFVDPETSDSCQPFDDPASALPSLFDEPVSRSPIIRTCVPHNPFFISTYC